MNLPEKNESYGEKDYWDERYAEEDEFDWFADYELFRHHVMNTIHKSDKILHLGKVTYLLDLPTFIDHDI